MRKKNFYEELGVHKNATKSEIKSAYRFLAKKYHPDTGGNKDKFLTIQLAWETLSDKQKKDIYDQLISNDNNSLNCEDKKWSLEIKTKKSNSTINDHNIKDWIKQIYEPSNKSISQIIKSLNSEIKSLSADPYDDNLMEDFSQYITKSRKKIERISLSYKSKVVPSSISSIGLDLYHCFSQVQDALDELERYTQGYVDNYLFDGKEMMKEAQRIQTKMKLTKKSILS